MKDKKIKFHIKRVKEVLKYLRLKGVDIEDLLLVDFDNDCSRGAENYATREDKLKRIIK